MSGEGEARPLVLVAGAGALPRIVAEAALAAGRPTRILALRGFAEADLRARAERVVDVLDVATILDQLRAWGACEIVLAGGVSRPSPAALASGVAAWRNRRELAEIFGRGDDHLLRAVIRLLEDEGHRVLGAHEVAPALLPAAGPIGGPSVPPEARATMAVGFACLAALSPFDIGQALVVENARILAVEGPEGTDRMLARVADLDRGRGFMRLLGGAQTKAEGVRVLVKGAKAGQDPRVDLATVGPRTVARAAEAGCRGIAIAAGATLVVDRSNMAAEADRLGIFVVACDPPREDPRA